MDDFQFCIQTLSYCIATLRIPNYFQTPTTFLIHYLTSVQHSKDFCSLPTKGDGKEKVKKKKCPTAAAGPSTSTYTIHLPKQTEDRLQIHSWTIR